MSFLSTTAYNRFSPNTKARSSEVNANFDTFTDFFNTTTSDIIIGSVRTKHVLTATGNTTASTQHNISQDQNLSTLIVEMQKATAVAVRLPTASSNAGRMLTIERTENTTTSIGVVSVSIDTGTSDQIEGGNALALSNDLDAATFISNGSTTWNVIGRNFLAAGGTASRKGVVQYNEENLDVSSNGDFDAANTSTGIRIGRVNNIVTMNWNSLSHGSTSTAKTNSSFVPSEYRPATFAVRNIYHIDPNTQFRIQVATDGEIRFDYFDHTGAGQTQTASQNGSISWIADTT